MNYQTAQLEMSAALVPQLPLCDLPEIVFSGKSNVGKSSLINKLLCRKALARVSAEPGKTVTVNFYKLDSCRIVDLPGYGYARSAKTDIERWSRLVEGYFAAGRDIRLVVQLLDCRHKPTADDISMLNFLIEKDIPFLVACTKSDKLNVSQRKAATELFSQLLGPSGVEFILFSSQNGENVELLRQKIDEKLV